MSRFKRRAVSEEEKKEKKKRIYLLLFQIGKAGSLVDTDAIPGW
jgi:hypothetical protein